MSASLKIEQESLPRRVVKRALPATARRWVRRSILWPEKIRYSLAARNIFGNDNHKRLQSLRNGHAGRRVFLIGGGPSIRKQNLSLIRHEVTICFNTFFNTARQLGWLPTYYLIEDAFPAEDNRDALNALTGTTKIYARDLRYCLNPSPETVYVHFDRHYAVYPSPAFPRFSSDFSRVVYWGGTVAYMGMQLAYYLGAKEIYLLGVDLSYDVPKQSGNGVVVANADSHDHAHPDDYGHGKRLRNPDTERMQMAIEYGANWLAQRGVSVYNATHGGNLQRVPRQDYDLLFGGSPSDHPRVPPPTQARAEDLARDKLSSRS